MQTGDETKRNYGWDEPKELQWQKNLAIHSYHICAQHTVVGDSGSSAKRRKGLTLEVEHNIGAPYDCQHQRNLISVPNHNVSNINENLRGGRSRAEKN